MWPGWSMVLLLGLWCVAEVVDVDDQRKRRRGDGFETIGIGEWEVSTSTG